MDRASSMAVAMALVALVAAMAAGPAAGQQTPACASKLTSCAADIFSNATTTPSANCCVPLRDALANDTACMCFIFKSPEILNAFHIDINKAFDLARRCGVSNTSICATGGAPSPAATAPPATSGDGKNAAVFHRASWFGMSGLVGLLLSWWFILA